jgi:hypothetical protein
MKRRGRVGLLSAALALGAMPAGAASSVDLEEVAGELRSDPVYVDPDAERALDADEVEELRSAIRGADTPIYIAVLPATAADLAGGDPAEVASQLAEAVDRDGTYGVVVGDSFRAGSSELPAGQAAELATDALDAGGDDTAAVLTDFVDRVADAAVSRDGATGSGGGDGGDDSGTNWVLPVLLAGAAAVGGVLLWRRSRRRHEKAAERARAEAADRRVLEAELSVLADDVVRLEPEVQLHPDARGDFDAAVSRYRSAQAALDASDAPIDLVRVARVVAEGRYLMDRVRAIIDGREPPPPPEELQRPGQHGEPAVTLDADRQPAYVGYTGGFQGGWFGGANGLFTGLLLGSLLSGGFGGWGHGGTTIVNTGDGGDSDFGDGDFGGGDFGGGDFGGGDFGGGDFGGGDF